MAQNIRIVRNNTAMLAGRGDTFQAFSSHGDIVRTLPAGGEILASNDFSPIQAAQFDCGRSKVWGVQYHPDFSPRFALNFIPARKHWLTGGGVCNDDAESEQFITSLESVKMQGTKVAQPNDLGWTNDILEPELRTNEIKNWLTEIKTEGARK